MSILIESPVFTLEAALLAAESGVDRLELCSSYAEGGETPGAGLFCYIKKNVNIPVYVMIRPRGGDFVYSKVEIEAMLEEISQFHLLGAEGFVFGILNPDGTINREACTALINAAKGKPCTFHRAFDVCRNQAQALEELINLGFTRVLTSGAKNNVEDGLRVIMNLMEQAGERIIIMPGGGMKPELVMPLYNTGYLKEIHASCKKVRQKRSIYHNPDVRISLNAEGENGVLTFDTAQYHRFKKVIEQI
jgi:copper homeostasis protein